MNRTMGIALVIMTAFAAGLLIRDGSRSEAEASVTTVGSEPALERSVRVRHDFVTVPLPVPPPQLETSGQPASAASPRLRRASEHRDTALSKARLAILGDGRFRPEPFPRVKP